MHFRRINQRLVGLDGGLQLSDLRLLGLEQLRRGPAFFSQRGVAREIGLGVDELSLIAFQVCGVLVDQGLIGTRVDLREQVPRMHGLAFSEIDADDLSLDLGANDVGVVRDHRAHTAKIDRHVVLDDRSGDDRHRGRRGGRGSGPLQRLEVRQIDTAGRNSSNQ